MSALFPYQVEGARFLASVGRGLLADEMGLGKTAQAITAAAAVRQTLGHPIHIAVVCPASLIANWRREFTRFWPGHDPQALQVISYDKCARHGLGNEDIDVLILDEAHYLKTRGAKRTKAIFGPKCDGVGGLVERAKHVFCLTGTPTPNNPSELWPMLRAVMPATIERENGRPLPFTGFVQRYCRTRHNGFGIQILGGRNLDDLKDRLGPYMLRRKKDQVMKDLPPIRFDELTLEGKFQSSEAADLMAVGLIEKTLAEKGVAGLKEIAPHVASLRRVTGMAKVAPAVEWIIDALDGGLKKLVVFAHHKAVIVEIGTALKAASVKHVIIDGGTASIDRQACVDKFQLDAAVQVFIGQIQAAGVGLTLTAASDVLFVESSWVPAENEQAAMRVHRIGQKNACIIRFATLAGSLDEQIQRAVMRKTADITKLFG